MAKKLKTVLLAVFLLFFIGAGFYGLFFAIYQYVIWEDGARRERLEWTYSNEWEDPMVLAVTCNRPFSIILDDGRRLEVRKGAEPQGDIELQKVTCSGDAYGTYYAFYMEPGDAVTVDLHGAKGSVKLNCGAVSCTVKGWNLEAISMTTDRTVSMTGGTWIGTKYTVKFSYTEESEKDVWLTGRCKGLVKLSEENDRIHIQADCRRWRLDGWAEGIYHDTETLKLPEDAWIEYSNYYWNLA